ncbi:MAG TPA: VacJ family lipoprotein [Gammaproteobacteria bacterium]|nr:VacJ family lipoprotein [Gammaproteobacteria bacterium]
MSLAIAFLGINAGCASAPHDPYDPLEPLNRQVFAFNRAADRMVLRPIARGYDTIAPRPVKSGVTHFFDNLATPVWVLNHLLQGNLAEAGKQSGRFLLNSTGGVLGLFDIAGDGGIAKNSANFNQTFGKWGMPSGPYLMLPLFGPSSVRASIGLYARYETDVVWNYLDDERSIRDKLTALDIINTRQRFLSLDRMIDQAADPYIFVREAWRQRSEYEIRDPGSPDDDIGLDFEDEDWDDEDY